MKTSLALAFAVGFSIAVPAVPGELVIGRVRLSLGMPQKDVLDALAKEFDPKQVSVQEGKYLLWARESRAFGLTAAGSVSFQDGRLYRASKTWGEMPRAMGAPTVVDGLFGVLSELTGKGWRVGRVRAETLRASGRAGVSGSVVKLVTLELPPDRKIQIQITEPLTAPGGPSFDRVETVEEFLVALPR